MNKTATMPAVRCDDRVKARIIEIAQKEDVPISVIQRRALVFFLDSVSTKCIDKETIREGGDQPS